MSPAPTEHQYLMSAFKKYGEDTLPVHHLPDRYDIRDLMAEEIYYRYHKIIEKIYKKIIKQVQKKPNQRWYFIDCNKYTDKQMISLRNYFKYTFKVSNEKPDDDKAYVIYKPSSVNTNNIVAVSTSNSYSTYSTLDVITDTKKDSDNIIKKPRSFYIYW